MSENFDNQSILAKIERRSPSQDDFGAPQPGTWVQVATAWVEVIPLTARELEYANSITGESTHRLTTSRYTDVTKEDRLKVDFGDGEVILDLEGVLPGRFPMDGKKTLLARQHSADDTT